MPNPNPDIPAFDTSRLRPVKTALISVSDKTNLIGYARELHNRGISLYSTGGTFKAIHAANIPVTDVSELTNYPEMMDGRVKTLHPGIHGGLLADRDLKSHVGALSKHNIQAIDLLIVNLYPFEDALARNASYEVCVENIDIGGPAMLRAAAKNHAHVCVCTDAQDVELVLNKMDMHDGHVDGATRQALAHKAFARTAQYDAAISNYFAAIRHDDAPEFIAQGGSLFQTLRYGENPHQSAALYSDGTQRFGVTTAQQIQGKSLSYNNINDTDAAYELVAEFGDADAAAKPTVAIIKHANPCGLATGDDFLSAYKAALACDPVSAFGGIIALNGTLDAATSEAIVETFTEVVIAPKVSEAAKAVFAKKKNLRLLIAGGLPDISSVGRTYRNVAGGFLVQDRDNGALTDEMLQVVTERSPSEQELRDLLIAWKIAKHVKSNAIVYVKDGASVGIGAGQMSRLDSARIAARKAEDARETAGWDSVKTIGSACASDAFFPFPDGMLAAAQAGATAIIQPGGSMRDKDVIAAANAAGLAMVFTGMRHFRH